MSTPSSQSSQSPECHLKLSGDKWSIHTYPEEMHESPTEMHESPTEMHEPPTELPTSGNSTASSSAKTISYRLEAGIFPLRIGETSFTSQDTGYEGFLPSPPAGEDGRGLCGPEWVPSRTHIYTFEGSDGTVIRGKLTGFTWRARDGTDGCILTLTIIV